MDYQEVKAISKFIVADNSFPVNSLTGGYFNYNLTKDELMLYLLGEFEEIKKGVTLNDFVNFRASIDQLRKMYKNLSNLRNMKLPKGYVNFYFPERISDEYLNIYEMIDLFYENRNLDNIFSKKTFTKMLGGNFIKRAKKLDYQLQQINQKQNKKKSSKSKKKKKHKGVVYLLKIKGKEQYKIGVSTKFKKRYDKLSTLMPFKLETVNLIKSDDIYSLEEGLHNKFEDKRINGEWFELSSEDIKYIKSIEDDIE